MPVIFERDTIAKRLSYGYTKAGGGSCVTEIAYRRDDQAGTDGIAMNGCNRRLGHAVEVLDNRLHFVLICNPVLTCEALKLLDIGTCCKCLARSTKNDGASVIVGG